MNDDIPVDRDITKAENYSQIKLAKLPLTLSWQSRDKYVFSSKMSKANFHLPTACFFASMFSCSVLKEALMQHTCHQKRTKTFPDGK